MDNFIVSARKYRPFTFSSVVGQMSITTTLKNAVKNNKLAQAFLFCGPRGVGKTTCARILAKTINCLNITDDFEPCNLCESCCSFDENASFHIYELDAASNNSVEDIRHLVEQVRIPPQSGKYKVYIIDEVHMLSQAAFNAFLKTLEEPPAYAKFILATTEKHKIIPTILSRCQIFDFKRMHIPDIVTHLRYVAEKENITYENEVLHIIAQKADGAMRDALSIFDQAVNFCGSHLEYKKVIENLNVLDYDYYFSLTDSFLKGDIPNALLLLNTIIDSGFDGQYFIMGLGDHLRNLLICRTKETVQLMEVSEEVKQRYIEQVQKCSPAFLLQALEINNNCDLNYKTTTNKRLLQEITLMKICSLNNVQETFKKEDETISTKSTIDAAQSTAISSTSISIKKPVKQENNLQNYLEALCTPFSQEKLNEVWQEMAKKVNTESIRIAFQARNPVLKENNRIVFEVENTVLAAQINDILIKLKEQLIKRLNNNQFHFELSVMQREETTYTPYTDEEKVQDMKKRNPALDDFMENLELRVEN
jgi:DNA polymerase-3 subunit gamma/tau